MNAIPIFVIIGITAIVSVGAAYMLDEKDVFPNLTGYFSKSSVNNENNYSLVSSERYEDNSTKSTEPNTSRTDIGNKSNTVVIQNTTSAIVRPSMRINEIMYNPEGIDEGNEWIELYNNGSSDVNISGWKFFEGNTNHKTILFFGSYVIPANSYFIITGNGTKFVSAYPSSNASVLISSFSLSNTGEYIALLDGAQDVLDSVSYSSSLGGNGNGMSIEYHEAGWYESSTISGTPGRTNSVPLVKIVSNSSTASIVGTNLCQNVSCKTINQTCEDGYISSCLPTCNNSTGACNLCTPDCSGHALPANTSSNLTQENITVNATGNSTESLTNQTNATQNTQTLNHVIISEVQTGPNEFVELYNPTGSDVVATGWYLSYFSSNRNWNEAYRNWAIPNNTILKANKFFLINISNTNDSDWTVLTAEGRPYSQAQISNNGSIGLFPFDPKSKGIEGARDGRIDAVGWGSPAYVFEFSPATAPENGKSLHRTAINIDTDNNLDDFLTNDNPSPKNSTNQ